jgi:hypothetical protein
MQRDADERSSDEEQERAAAGNRRARCYTLTTAGKTQLGVEASRCSQMFGAIMGVMTTT